MLSVFKDDAAVGIYNAAYVPLLAVTTIISQYKKMNKNNTFLTLKANLINGVYHENKSGV